ncbi:MAG: hypothetical protein ABGY42_02560, partial [bacterium]
REQIGSYFPSLPATLWWKDCAGCFAANIYTGGLYKDTALFDILLKLVYWSPLVLGAFATCIMLTRAATARREGLSAALRGQLLILALGLGFLAAFSKPRDWVHLMMIYPPVLLAAVMAGQQQISRLPKFFTRATAGLLGMGLALLFASTLVMVVDMRRVFDHYLAFDRGQVYADRQNGPLIDAVVTWQAENIAPDQPLPSWPTQPALVFLSGRATVGGYHVIWPGQNPARDGVLREALEQRDVNHLLFSISQWGQLGSFGAIAPDLYRYLVENFEIHRTFSHELYGPILVALERDTGASAGRAGERLLVSDLFAMRSWPFAPVQSQPVATDAGSEAVRIPLDAGSSQRTLVGSVGINPDRWFGPPAGPFDFIIEIEEGSQRHVLLRKRVDPRHAVGDRRWHPFTVDLTPYAGRATQLVFRVHAPTLHESPQNLAGWKGLRFLAH